MQVKSTGMGKILDVILEYLEEIGTSFKVKIRRGLTDLGHLPLVILVSPMEYPIDTT